MNLALNTLSQILSTFQAPRPRLKGSTPDPRHGRHLTEKPSIQNSNGDLFATDSMKVNSMVVEYLSSKNIAKLGLTTQAVRQLPDILLRRLLLEAMTRMREVEDMAQARLDGWA